MNYFNNSFSTVLSPRHGAWCLMVVVSWKLGVSAIIDWVTALLALLSLIAITRLKVNSAWLILIGGIGGFMV